jgi:small subunit ribosomal protein S16
MAVSLRLARHGKRHRPFYHIVAATKSARRDGRFLEKLGTYDPNGGVLKLDVAAAEKWVHNGALPSATVGKLLKRAAAATSVA